MRSPIIWIATFALAFTLGCSRDEAKTSAEQAAENVAGQVNAAPENLAVDAVAACQRLAEQNAWDQALEVCKKAHEMMPDDLALEHAYQQAQAAAN